MKKIGQLLKKIKKNPCSKNLSQKDKKDLHFKKDYDRIYNCEYGGPLILIE